MTTSEVAELRKEVVEIKKIVDTLSRSVTDFHDKVELKNIEQDVKMADLQEKADVIYGAVRWLGTTGKIIKYTAGILVAIASIASILTGYLKAFIITNLRF
jgi:hypothetical protein